jgi:hypothetical protein
MTEILSTAQRQLEQFLEPLFLPDELIELRFIESWTSGGKKNSRVVRSALWLTRDEFLSQQPALNKFAKRKRANIYFGVCPRPQEGDADDQTIETIRCLWCDIDHITADEAYARWEAAGVPRPSIVVSSGSGIHGYWVLEDDLTSSEDRSKLASVLPRFYRSFGGDHVQNLSRVMRPPGTFNYKDARNRRPPVLCRLCACEPQLRYPFDAFSQWMAQEGRLTQKETLRISSQPPIELTTAEILTQHPEAGELISRLDKPSPDRSRRDFAIVCDLLRLGLSNEEIWQLVSESSKFESSGRPYFEVTVANAERTVVRDGTAPCRPGAFG